MAFFSKFKIGSTSYDVKDALAGKSLSLSGSNLSLLKADGTAASTVTLPGGKAYGMAHFEADSDHAGYNKIVFDDVLASTVPAGNYNGILYILKGDAIKSAGFGGTWRAECNSDIIMQVGRTGSNSRYRVQMLNTGHTYFLYVYRNTASTFNMELLNPFDNVFSSSTAAMYGSDIDKIKGSLLGVPIYSNTSKIAFKYKDNSDADITDSNHMLVLYHNGLYAYISMALAKAPNKVIRNLRDALETPDYECIFISDPDYIMMPMENTSYRKLYTLTKTAANNFTVDNVSNWTNYNWITVGRYSFV